MKRDFLSQLLHSNYEPEDERYVLEVLIKKALEELYIKDGYLIGNIPIDNIKDGGVHHVGERAIVFRFAHYLQNLMNLYDIFADYNLDCEYNRNGIMAKKLPSFPNGTYPDVILHKRSSNDCNILVIEIKTHWNREQSDDYKKIWEFTDPLGKYKFRYGVTILLELKSEDVKIDWFVNGKSEECIL